MSLSGQREVNTEVARQLRELAVWYASAVDRRDAAALADVFWPDASLLVNRAGGGKTEYHGAEEISHIAQRITHYPRTFHFLGQSAYADGESDDEATGEIYCMAHHITPDDSPEDIVMYIRYHDDYAQRGGLWRIVRRQVNVDFETTHARVGQVLPAPNPGARCGANQG